MRGDVLDAVPEYVLGEWASSDARFVDRGITVRSEEVLLERGPEAPPGGGSLIEARQWMEGESTVIQLEYVGPDGREFLQMIFDAEGAMHLRNPREVQWTRRALR